MKSTRRSDLTAELVVGVFVFLLLVALGVFTIIISKHNLFSQKQGLTILFTDVQGLKVGENVHYRGMIVGTVKATRMTDGGRVAVDIEIEEEVRLREGARFAVQATSLLGGKKLVITDGPLDARELDLTGSLSGLPPKDLMEEAGEVVSALRKGLNEGGVIRNLEKTAKNIAEITENINRGTGTVARLISDGTLHREAVALLDRLNRAGEDISVLTARLRDGKGSLARLLSDDDSLYVKIDSVASNLVAVSENLKTVSQRLEAGEGTLGKLMAKNDELYANILAVSKDLRAFSGNLNNPESTVGRLMNEDKLYQEVRALVQDLRATVDDFRETSPITTFSSIFFGAF